MPARGLLIVVSGPAAVGKGTMCECLLKQRDDVTLSISATTRAPRGTEVDGVEYFFKTEGEFMRMRADGELLECANVHGNWYGTPREFALTHMNSGRHVLLEIDVQGGRVVKQNFPNAVTIFVLPPSLQTLKDRLIGRGTETAEQREIRLHTAMHELTEVDTYEYAIVNDALPDAVDALNSVIEAEIRRINKGILNDIPVMQEIHQLGGHSS